MQIDLWQGDLTTFACDAMVNAANAQLAGGGGVDGAIHRVGGPTIMAACRTLGGCATGKAVTTEAGKLPAQWVIHAVGPVWHGGGRGEAELLASAYRESLREAVRVGARHVAFPSLSTGAYGYPLDAAAAVAVAAVVEFIEREAHVGLGRVTFVLWDRAAYMTYRDTLFRQLPESE